MIGTINLNDKDYEQFRREAVEQIPIYNNEWTNHNVSDPGITIIENLSAFTALLQSELNTVPEKVKWRLLALAGFYPREGKPAVEYVKPIKYPDEAGATGEKIYVHGICYEPEAGWRFTKAFILGIYAVHDPDHADRITDLSLLAGSHGIAGGVRMWGKHPMAGARLYFLFDRLYEKQNGIREIFLCFTVKKKYNRNLFEENSHNPFAEIQWEILTDSGFDKLEEHDTTYCFLQSGFIMLKTASAPGRLRRIDDANGKKVYCIRATLVKAAYDMAPVVESVAGPLAKIRQTDTLSALTVLSGEEELQESINETLLQNGESSIFTLAAKSFYRLERVIEVRSAGTIDDRKETVRKILLGETAVQGELALISRDKRVLPYAALGTLYGYDDQELDLPPMYRVYSQNFSIMIRCSAAHVMAFTGRDDIAAWKQDDFYHIVSPGKNETDEVKYSVMEKENKIVIHDCGCFEGAEVFLGNYCIYQGSKGGVRAETVFTGEDDKIFYSFEKGINGRYKDTFEQTRKRFVKDLNTPATAVTASDCELLVRSIPGLSIAKVKAYAEKGKNRIHVVVRPNSEKGHPKLSDAYAEIIRKYMEERRMLSTRIIVESPVYIAINVHLSIRVKKAYMQAEKRVKAALDKLFNSAYGEFGQTVYFHHIYEKIHGMEFIEEIYELTIDTDNKRACKISGAGITLAHNALCCAGKYRIDITG